MTKAAMHTERDIIIYQFRPFVCPSIAGIMFKRMDIS